MARTFQEIEVMMRAEKKFGVVTQMGNQGHSEANYFQFKAWKEAGLIKDVTAITAHMNSPRRWHNWNPNITHMPMGEPVPETLDWDTWLGVRPFHEYNHDYHWDSGVAGTIRYGRIGRLGGSHHRYRTRIPGSRSADGSKPVVSERS